MEYVAFLYYNEEPCRVYGPFASEEEATDWLCSRNDYDASVINELRKPEKDLAHEADMRRQAREQLRLDCMDEEADMRQHDHALALEDFDPITEPK